MEELNNLLIVGFIRAPHGVKGNFKVESTSGEYEHFEKLEEVALRKGDSGELKKFKVESVEAGSQTLFLKLKGIDSPEDARKYGGFQILVPRENACPCGKDEWYVVDLIGCDLMYALAEDAAPVKTGTITDVLEGGTGDLLEVLLAESCNLLEKDVIYDGDGKVRKVLVPLSEQFIGKVDVKKKEIQLMHLWILE